MDLLNKLEILADAAKYDASCASSAADRKAAGKQGIGSTGGTGICHSYTPDGRCISLLKVLLTNVCLYDCHYCINRRSSTVRRAAFTPEEVTELTFSFYKRNYIEGLFLSSGIIRSADYTMELLIRVAKLLRVEHKFAGYIHLKTIPEASPELIAEAGKFADRLSINTELPSQRSLETLAPEKSLPRAKAAMGVIHERIAEAKEEKVQAKKSTNRRKARNHREKSRFARSQSTQMIVGADDSRDLDFLSQASQLYGNYQLKRVYYSAFSPIPAPSVILPLKSPPLIREHRLYQADWLLRFYGYQASELLDQTTPNLELDIDPKLSWALRHPEQFPVDLNRAPYALILRVPGLGVRNAKRLISLRRFQSIRLEDLIKLRVSVKKALPFMICANHHPAKLDDQNLRERFAPKPEQLEFDFGQISTTSPKHQAPEPSPQHQGKQSKLSAAKTALNGEF